MASLDWPFTPTPRSPERFERQNRLRPPPCFGRASPCPGVDRLASGLPPWTPGERTPGLAPCGVAPCRFRCGSPLRAVNLAHDRNSPARFSKRKRSPWSQTFRAKSAYDCLVSGTFHLSLEALFSFRSRYYCAIGLGTCLGLGVDATRIRASFPRSPTLDPRNRPLTFPLRGFHSLWLPCSTEIRVG